MECINELSRIIIVSGMINHPLDKTVIEQIYKINEFDDKESENKVSYERQPIKLIINSYGGYCNSMFAIIDTIINSKTPVYTHATGVAQSAGAMILLCGENGHRTASQYSEIMIHDVTGFISGKPIQLKNELKQIEYTNKNLLKLFDSYAKIPQDIIDQYNNSGQEIYLTPDEALEYGIIDEIV